MDLLKDLKQTTIPTTEQEYIEFLITRKLEDVHFEEIQIQVEDRLGYEYKVLAKHEEKWFDFEVNIQHFSEYAPDEMVFLLRKVYNRERQVEVMAYMHGFDDFSKVLAPYFKEIESIRSKEEKKYAELKEIVDIIRQDVSSFEGYHEEINYYHHDPVSIKVGEKLSIQKEFSNALTLSIPEYNDRYSINVTKGVKHAVSEWKTFFHFFQKESLETKGIDMKALFLYLQSLEQNYRFKKAKLNISEALHEVYHIEDVVLGQRLEKQVKLSIQSIPEQLETITVHVNYLNRSYKCEVTDETMYELIEDIVKYL